MDYSNITERMEKTIHMLEENLAEIRAGRANPAILNKIQVSYYGVPTPINQVAGISVPEARMIVIQPWDASILKEIEKNHPEKIRKKRLSEKIQFSKIRHTINVTVNKSLERRGSK